MDTILFAVGSFAVSERVLKPKASVLVILGCVLAYDLTTKTHDISALRVYRGPSFLAFTFMMAAWSLRTWRRNGVACDELLFLPGTRHGQRLTSDDDDDDDDDDGHLELSEGDAAAGPPPRRRNGNSATEVNFQEVTPMLQDVSHDEPNITTTTIEMTKTEESHPSRERLTSIDDDSLVLRISTSVEDDSSEDEDFWDREEANENDVSTEGDAGLFQRPRRMNSDSETGDEHDENGDNETNLLEERTRMQRFQESHPQIVRIGSFFFFRSSNTTTQNATYAPSGPSVFGAALDLSMPILINFHVFIVCYNQIDKSDPNTEFTAKILPLIFLSVLIVRTIIPPGRRRRFWSTMRFTMMAPFYKVRFRDAFIGDVLTSLVRPFQDILFALSYYATSFYGIVVQSYGIPEAGRILEQSWVLHNVILPSCALLPLWWRFLQELRAAYDNNKRWPYYGNALKYLSAAILILYGMTHREGRRSAWWIISFIGAVLYQIWWDTIMEWELFVLAPRVSEANASDVLMTSWRPENKVLLALHMHLTQPFSECLRRIGATIPTSFRQIQLRPQRLYKNRLFYIRGFAINAALRFLWILCFIPAYRLETAHSGKDMVKLQTFSSDVNSFLGVLLPIAEIVRRTIWGFFKLEMQTIRMMEEHHQLEEQQYSQVQMLLEEDGNELDDISDKKGSSSISLPFWLDAPHHHHLNQTPQNQNVEICNWAILKQKIFLIELVFWAFAFVGLGYCATY